MSFLEKVRTTRKIMRCYGFRGCLGAVVRKFNPDLAKTFPVCRNLVAGKRGFEIGGPSQTFSRGGIIPIYPAVGSLDNCNFSDQTLWENALTDGDNFKYDLDKPPGHQYISEARSLPMIPSGKYGFVLSCHSLEHTANPLGTLKESLRILDERGALILILPHMEGTFDHLRPVTTLDHMIGDLKANTDENDKTHVPEILEFYDIGRDWGVNNIEELKARAAKNLENRAIHHHVFNVGSAAAMLDYVGLQIRSAEGMRPFHIILSAEKLPKSQRPDNESFLSPNATWRQLSYFKTDRE